MTTSYFQSEPYFGSSLLFPVRRFPKKRSSDPNIYIEGPGRRSLLFRAQLQIKPDEVAVQPSKAHLTRPNLNQPVPHPAQPNFTVSLVSIPPVLVPRPLVIATVKSKPSPPAMAGDAAVPAGAAAAKRLPKEEEDDDELDNVPLSVSRAKKASASKAKKEEEEDDDSDNIPISRARAKKVCSPSQIQKFPCSSSVWETVWGR